MLLRLVWIWPLLVTVVGGYGQELADLAVFVDYASSEGYEPADWVETRIVSQAFSNHTGARHIHYQQVFRGIHIYGAITTLTIHQSESYVSNNNFLKKLSAWEFTGSDGPISPGDAYKFAGAHLRIPAQKSLQISDTGNPHQYALTDPATNESLSYVQKVWFPETTYQMEAAWQLNLADKSSPDRWVVLVAVADGRILKTSNQTLYCRFDGPDGQLSHREISSNTEFNLSNFDFLTDGSSYLVYPYPLENPLQGDQEIVRNASDTVASPFGWHDVDGIPGPEYTITRGNNVHAFQDDNADNQSSGDEPDGGEELAFIFAHDKSGTSVENLHADVTNLFYWSNLIHDWAYRFGFDEVNGNFQANNYDKGGAGEDYLIANTLDGNDTNNASFFTPSDGVRPVMSMYPWLTGSNSLSIDSPEELAGRLDVGTAEFGPRIEESLPGRLVLVDDADSIATDACTDLVNVAAIEGNIALVDRGECFFIDKVERAENAGAMACIVCNNVAGQGIINMGAPDNAQQVSIPAVLISKEDCDVIKAAMEQGSEIAVTLDPVSVLSSSFDNGVVIHEYAHGISNRLTGGPMSSSCLTNDEQVGEGWSDFLALVLTTKPDDIGNQRRPIGTYLVNPNGNGTGIRRYPYSTDMAINPQLHTHIRRTTSPHAVGEIWSAALWDLYWKFIERDGFDPSWSIAGSGNVKCVQLVFDGMKIQSCNPGILESRDAILMADEMLNAGANRCMIWEVFARRGMGTDATGGDPDDRMDNTNGFLIPPECSNAILLNKEVAASADAGDTIRVVLSLFNGKADDLEDLVLTDELPIGTRVEEASATQAFEVRDGHVTFQVDNLPGSESMEIQYKLILPDRSESKEIFLDDFEGALQFQRMESSSEVEGWRPNTAKKQNGIFSINVPGDTLSGEAYLVLTDVELSPVRPGLRFWHTYDIQRGIDGGVVEISQDQGSTWTAVPLAWFLNGPYNDRITRDFLYEEEIDAYTGKEDWSEVILDLSALAGETIDLRLRYIMDKFDENIPTPGWFIDDLEIMDMHVLETKTCAILDTTEQYCVKSNTLLNVGQDQTTPVELIDNTDAVRVFPNPAGDYFTISWNHEKGTLQRILLRSPLGHTVKVVTSKDLRDNNEQILAVDELPPGLYYLEILKDDKTRFTIRVAIGF